MNLLKVCIAVMILAVLCGCGPRHPLGIPDEQWQAMSPEQQFQARQQQADLDRAKAEQRAEEAKARVAEAEAKKAELERRRQDARYGERVQCVFSNGEVKLRREWDRIHPVALDLVRGYEEEFRMEVASDRMRGFTTEGYALFDGQTVYLCRMPYEDVYRQDDCVRVTATMREFQRGVEQYVSAADFLRGRIRCDLPPEGEPGRIIVR